MKRTKRDYLVPQHKIFIVDAPVKTAKGRCRFVVRAENKEEVIKRWKAGIFGPKIEETVCATSVDLPETIVEAWPKIKKKAIAALKDYK